MIGSVEPVELARRMGIPWFASLEAWDGDPRLLARVPMPFARSRQLLPLCIQEGRLLVATAQPADLSSLDEVGVLFSLPVEPVATSPEALLEALNRFYSGIGGSSLELVEELEGEDLSAIADELSQPRDLLDLVDEAPVIRLLNSILTEAVKERASDVHIEPYERSLEVRFRIDGILYRKLAPPRGLQEPLASRVKIMAGLDIAEKRLPQDGRIRLIIAGRDVDVRVSIIPTSHGERTVMRILDRKGGLVTLDDTGLSERYRRQVDRLLTRTGGIILVTGPTGSGKTTTLYAAINSLNSPERNIITIEDPIEYQIKGIGQMQVNPRIELSFAAGLRSILRQDPDVIMVGEIRDTLTAEIAMQASLTGHLVLSTLHTNDSATAVTRLVDMGVEPYLVASSLNAVIAQRLVRRICPHCRAEGEPVPMPDGSMSPSFQGTGCSRCVGTGYLGRSGIHEVMIVDQQLSGLINSRGTARELKEMALQRGMKTMRDDGLEKVAAGITTLSEVVRVTQEEYADLEI